MEDMAKVVYHSEYDVQNPPAKPSQKHVRFVFISDTHSMQPIIPEGDVLLHSGDLTDLGGTKAFEQQISWLSTLPHPHKVFISGNHDFGACTVENWYERVGRGIQKKFAYDTADVNRVKEHIEAFEGKVKPGGTHRYLEDDGVEVECGGKVWSIWGSPWSPEFGGWAWNYKRGEEAKQVYAKMPPKPDILLTHSPPMQLGKLDVLTDGVTSVGCEELQRKLEQGEVRPLVHAFGHIHEARGVHSQKWETKVKDTPESTLLINAAVVQFDMEKFKSSKLLEYTLVHPPVIVDIDPQT